MMPEFQISLLGTTKMIHSGGSLMLLTAVLVLFLFHFFSPEKRPFIKNLFIVCTVSLFALLGGRLFHVFFEKFHYFSRHPEEVFSSFQGLTFYGAIAGGIIGLKLVIKGLFIKKEESKNLWDMGAIFVSLGYGILRVACFLSGCCWGKLTDHIFAVRFFHPHSVMPFKGLPVHPVQLYDSLLGFALAMFLFVLYKKGQEHRGQLMQGKRTKTL
jgi:prolipoprotein diacylglyceryltransferase